MKCGPALLAAGCVALAGCAVLNSLNSQESLEPAPWVQAGTPQPTSDSESLLLYYQHLRKLPGTELGREHETVRQAYTRSRTDFNRVRYAMVLSLPNTAFADDNRAQELFDAVAKNPAARLQGLAQMLSSNLQEQRKLTASLQGMQQKLDALKSLERNMIERNR